MAATSVGIWGCGNGKWDSLGAGKRRDRARFEIGVCMAGMSLIYDEFFLLKGGGLTTNLPHVARCSVRHGSLGMVAKSSGWPSMRRAAASLARHLWFCVRW